MDQLTRTLVKRLIGKGVEIHTIPSFIRDVTNTISVDGDSSLQELNRRLQLLGWINFELDDFTLQLIIALFENNGLKSPVSSKSRSIENTSYKRQYGEIFNTSN